MYEIVNPKGQKMRLGLLFGGRSSEYAVSLQSAAGVLHQLQKLDCEVYPIGLAQHTGQWYWYRGPWENIPADRWLQQADCLPVCPATDQSAHGLWCAAPAGLRLLQLDAALPILHGKNGEDGTVQGALALAGIPLRGCGVLASAVGMDKDVAHRLAAAAGVAVPRSVLLRAEKTGLQPAEAVVRQAQAAARTLGWPLFVKPVRAGSSYGISRVTGPAALADALREAFSHDDEVLLEEAIPGFEVGCAVLGDGTPLTGAIDEIELAEGFFDYTEKYTLKTSRIHVPARLSAEKAEEVRQAALTVYRALKCSGFARVDLFVTPAGTVLFNEVNTIPGFTAHSRYPGMLAAAGIPFDEVLRRILWPQGAEENAEKTAATAAAEKAEGAKAAEDTRKTADTGAGTDETGKTEEAQA